MTAPFFFFSLNERICLRKREKKKYMKNTNELQMASLTSSGLID